MTDKYQSSTPRLLRWTGFALTAIAGVVLALNYTAVPVILNVPLASLVIAGMAVVFLALHMLRMRAKRTTATRRVNAACLAAALAIAAVTAQMSFLSFAQEDIVFHNGEVALSGTLYLPRASRPHPATVIVHGSGPESRHEYAYYARRFARAGIASLVYDKRGVGESTGKLYQSDFRDYAADITAAVRVLRSRPDIRADQVGLVGFSEAEWTAPLAALEAGDIPAIAIIGASGTSPARQVNAEIAIRMRARGHSDAVIAEALELNDRVFAYQRTGHNADELKIKLNAASTQPWFHDAGDIPDQIYPIEEYAWWRSVMDFDPAAVWERISVPVLILKGGHDAHSPAEVARRKITSALERGGNPHIDFVLVPDGDHMLLKWPLGHGVPPPVFADAYLQTLIEWMKAKLENAAQPHAAADAALQRG